MRHAGGTYAGNLPFIATLVAGLEHLTCTTSDPRYICKRGAGSVTTGFAVLGNWDVYGP